MFYTYTYKDPRDGLPFYVGKGKGDRVFSHLKESHNNKVQEHIRELKAINLKPIIEIREHSSEDKAYDHEVELIKKYGRLDLSQGTLYNLTNGAFGLNGLIVTKEVLEKRKTTRLKNLFKRKPKTS